jgi:hypothetical protein
MASKTYPDSRGNVPTLTGHFSGVEAKTAEKTPNFHKYH